MQLEAVTHLGGPLLIIAGAGSGKTRVLTHRIAYLIRDCGVSPFGLLAITFTNKAADEMKKRVADLVGPVAHQMWVSTFHSACVRILRSNATRLGFTNSFTIYDAADAVRLTGYVLRDFNIDTKKFPPRTVHATISAAKNDLVDPEKYKAMAQGVFERKIGDVYAEYQRRLQAANAMDFDDLLVKAVELFNNHPDVLNSYRERFEHILVDEYQDTNKTQNELVIQLARQHRNVCVVGDGDQCLPGSAKIRLPDGSTKPIEELTVGERIVGIGGKGDEVESTVEFVKQSHYQGPFCDVRAGDLTLRGTAFHTLPADPAIEAGRWMVYLMYRADRGYRIGQVKSVRKNSVGLLKQGVKVRVGQEHADKAWILRVCDSRAEASFFESYYSARFGLPTACFHGVGRKLAMDESWLARLYDELNTEGAAKWLMEELDLHADYPHFRPQNGGNRQTLNLTKFSDARGGDQVGYHRVQWSSIRTDVINRLLEAGYPLRPGKSSSLRYETSREDYGEAQAIAKAIAEAGGMEVNKRSAIAGQVYQTMPLSHLRPGMHVLVDVDGRLERRRVDEVDVEWKQDHVYDIEVSPTHNYVADGVVVENSIFRFRGADMRNILDFENAFEETKVVMLEQNYRSTQKILDAANAVISNNEMRKPKVLFTEQQGGELIERYQAEDEHDEARWIVNEMHRLHEHEQYRWSEIALFYRANAQSRVVEEQLARAGIPYKVVGGTRFYDRREVKDLIAYVRAAINPADEISIRRVVNVPKRGVGDTSLAKIEKWALQNHQSFGDALRHADDAGVSGKALSGVKEFVALLDELWPPSSINGEQVDRPSPADLLEAIADRSGYRRELEAERSIEAESRLENIAELIGNAGEFETVEQFLESVSLVADSDELDPDASQVVLMTLHTAKGLEFPCVFIVGMEEGVFPHLRSLGEPEELEEERRLAYVGITRARERLYLTHAWSRTLWGNTQYNPPSRFVNEIPEHLQQQRGEAGTGWRSGGIAGARSRMVESAMRRARVPRDSVPKGASGLDLKPGEDIVHAKWGEGVVLEVGGSGEDAEALVRFPGLGEKRLLLAMAPIKRA